ncbi:MAG: hypothetical protein WAW92_00285 [Minisyncoccia bacterium]
MKTCKYCGNDYPESYFGVALTTESKVYKRHKCKFCYQRTKDILRKKNGRWLNEYKASRGCKVCGNNDYRVLEFHHLDKSKKDFSISFAQANRFGLEKMQQEIKKCDILCANCHRLTHWQEDDL